MWVRSTVISKFNSENKQTKKTILTKNKTNTDLQDASSASLNLKCEKLTTIYKKWKIMTTCNEINI